MVLIIETQKNSIKVKTFFLKQNQLNTKQTKMMKYYLLLTIVGVFSFSAFAQKGSLSGVVSFGEKEGYVSDATVLIKDLNRYTFTDEKGNFSFPSLPFGQYELIVNSIEVEQKTFQVQFSEDNNKPIILTVSPSSINLSEVVAIGLSQKAQIETKGFAANVIEIKTAALQSIQTNELLDRSAGVRIRQDGGLGSHTHYNINGMTGNAVRIFIDGVPASNYGQSFSLNSIPPSLIERIEIYKGVVPGYLSSDALGGAINVILKQSKGKNLNVSHSYGSFNTHQFNMNGGYKTEKGFTVNASAFYNYSDNNYEVWGEEITFRNHDGVVTPNQKAKRFHDAFRSYGSKVDVGWSDVKWADRFSIGSVLSEDYKEIQNGVSMQRVFGDRHSRRNAKIATLVYSKRDILGTGLSLNVDVSYSHLESQIIDSVGIVYDWRGAILYPDGTPVKYTNGAELGSNKTAQIDTDKAFVVRANLGYQINDNNLIHVNYLFNNFDRGISDEFLPLGLQKLQNTRDLQKNMAAFTYENLSVSNRLRTNVFYKYYYQKVISNEPYQVTTVPPVYDITQKDKVEDYHGYGTTFSFSLKSNFYILGSVEKAIRFPSEREIFGNPASNLNPGAVSAEQSLNTNIGVNVGPYTFHSHSVRLNTSFFYRDTKGMIKEAMTPGNSGTSYFENLEDVLTRGVDAEIIYNYINKFNLTFNISKFDVLFNTKYNKNGAEYLFYRQQIRNEPSFKYNAAASYYINNLFLKKSKASLSYNINYVEGFRRNWSNTGLTNLDNIPTQFSNSMGFMFTFPSEKITVSFDAKNIFNEQLYDNFGLQKPGRSFYGKITYNIF